jgi:Holliday junction resolvasome RuvABC endonuclease subunit
MNHGKNDELVLGIQATTRGFGFALFEAPLSPIDWGAKEIRKRKNETTLEKVASLIEWYQPTVIVLESTRGGRYRRSARIRRLFRGIAQLARTRNVEVYRYSRAKTRACFEQLGATTKHEIAQVLGKHLPALQPHVPRRRKIWMSEDHRMSIFDATALIFTYFYRDADHRVPRANSPANGRR